MNCRKYELELLDLASSPANRPLGASAVERHVADCSHCTEEVNALRSTLFAMNEWPTPEISPWFDQRLSARLREAVRAEPEGFFERLRSRVLFTSNMQLRPMMAATLALVLAIGGGSYVALSHSITNRSAQSSATIEDLQRMDNNATTLQQINQLVDDDAAS